MRKLRDELLAKEKEKQLQFEKQKLDMKLDYEKKSEEFKKGNQGESSGSHAKLPKLSITTVPVKCKLTVSTRSSKLNSRVSNVETFEFRDARIEDRVEYRVSRIEKHGVFEYANSKRSSRKRFISRRMNNSRSHT